jgi:hypothetical protein
MFNFGLVKKSFRRKLPCKSKKKSKAISVTGRRDLQDCEMLRDHTV